MISVSHNEVFCWQRGLAGPSAKYIAEKWKYKSQSAAALARKQNHDSVFSLLNMKFDIRQNIDTTLSSYYLFKTNLITERLEGGRD